jgi:hypothetical protein
LRKNNLKPEQRQAAAKSTTISIKDTWGWRTKYTARPHTWVSCDHRSAHKKLSHRMDLPRAYCWIHRHMKEMACL